MKLPREALSRLYKKFKAAIDGIIVGLKTDRSIRVQWLIAIVRSEERRVGKEF